jgi:hypothetical protein
VYSSIIRFSIEHLLIDGYVLHRMPRGPAGQRIHIPLVGQHKSITLRCQPVEGSRASNLVKMPLHIPHGNPSNFLLEIGWKNRWEKRLGAWDEAAHAWGLISAIVRTYGRAWNVFNHFVISPYLGEDGNDHSFCFGEAPPSPDLSSPALPRIEFRSDCSCGNGDITKCKQGLTNEACI